MVRPFLYRQRGDTRASLWLFPAWLGLALPCSADEAFPPVVPGYTLQFPRDHAAHLAFRVEWWYFTGFLQTEPGGPRTFQVTFFRLRPEPGPWEDNPSRFTPHQIVMTHAALGDPGAGTFEHWERLGRVGLGLAEVSPERLRVRLGHWLLGDKPDPMPGRGRTGTWHTRIDTGEMVLDLDFHPLGPIVLHGDRGFSPKGRDARRASYYYSIPNLEVSGSLRQDGRESIVQGRAWMDHEWSSEPMDPDHNGWDWVGLRFDNGAALMAYRFRDTQGGQRFLAGTWVEPNGSTRVLDYRSLSMQPTGKTWTSPRTGLQYPLEWRILANGLNLTVEALFANQEMDTRIGPRYWEGAVTVRGDLRGEGFLEMTGAKQNFKF